MWPLLQGLPRWLYGWRLGRSRQLRWFNDRLARARGVPTKDFLGSAVQLAHGGSDRHNTPLVRRILMLALLADLDAALRPSWISVPRRRRNWPFVLLFPAVGASDDDSACGFLGTYTDLVRQRGSSPVMVLTAVVGPAPVVRDRGGRRI